MIIAITGTPGVGKTTVSKILKQKIGGCLIPVNELVDEKSICTGIHKEKGYKIVDLYRLFDELDILIQSHNSSVIIIEGHLSHLYENCDSVIVLRAHPMVLKERMSIKNWTVAKINENIDAEIIGVCSYEAYEIYGEKASEIDTSHISPYEVSDLIIEVINSEKIFPVGNVDFIDYLME